MKKILLVVGAVILLVSMLFLASCTESTVNGKNIDSYSSDGLVKKIYLDGGKYNYFTVTIKDKENEIKISTSTLTYNVGDSVHVDFSTKTIYSLKDKENVASFQ